MTLNKYPGSAIRVFVWLGIVLATVSTSSAEWKERVLYSFQGGADGVVPIGGVVFDKEGNLYGATQQGGGTDCSPMAACGTVYQLVAPAKPGDPWTENVLHTFQGKQHNDGEFPSGGVIGDASGNIYGTSSYGGNGDCVLLGIKGGCGTVFELSPPQTKGGKWTYTIVYSFKGGKDGYLPFGDLVFDSTGNLYGATYFGGGKGTTCNPYYQYCGTVFRLSPPKTKGGKWTEKVLHSFAGGTDGANPNGGLTLDSKGTIYGTTYAGGNQNCKYDASVGCGTAFELHLPNRQTAAWEEKQLHVFTGGHDGGQPNGGLVFDDSGSLYGTAGGGNVSGGGIVFRLTMAKGARWNETVLHWFSNNGAGGSDSGVIFDSTGNLYGTTVEGAQFCGTVFQLSHPAGQNKKWGLNLLHTFQGSPDGRHPAAPMIFDLKGNLYGTTLYGGNASGDGTVFEVFP